MRVCHVINVVGASARGDLREAQTATLRSMELARLVASPSVDIVIVGSRFPDEELPAPWLADGVPLTRSVLDVGHFPEQRRLPLLGDILDSLKDRPFDLGVFTNIDIVLQPQFYDLIAEIHQLGHDAFTINRRTVHTRHDRNGPAWLASQTGSAHPGHDCFVFTPEVLKATDVDEVCVGVPLVSRALLFNHMLAANNFRQFVDLNATYHIGDDRSWAHQRFDALTQHNHRALGRVMLRLAQTYGEDEVQRLPDGARFLNAAQRDNSSPFRPRRPDPKHVWRSRSTDRRRLIFAASPGRAGTAYLAALLLTGKNVSGGHEIEPTMTGRHLRSVAYSDSALSYAERSLKADALRRQLATLPPSGVLVDTSHMFVKTFADVVCDAFNHDRISVVKLDRPLHELVSSMTQLGWFTINAPAWRHWLIPPTAPSSRFPIEPHRIESRLDLAIGYVLDSEIRTRELRATTPGVHWVDLAIDTLRSRADLECLFRELRITPTNATWVQGRGRVNDKAAIKRSRGVAMSDGLVRAGIASFASRFDEEIANLGVDHVFEEYV